MGIIELTDEERRFLLNGIEDGMRGLNHPESYPPFIKILNSIRDKLR